MAPKTASPDGTLVGITGIYVSRRLTGGDKRPREPNSAVSSESAACSDSPSPALPPRQVFVRVCLGGTVQQLLPLETVRKEHPQLLINYLLSVTQIY